MEWNGMEWNGWMDGWIEWNGMEWNGMDECNTTTISGGGVVWIVGCNLLNRQDEYAKGKTHK